MLVREVMTADPASVQPDTSIKEALGLLAELRVTSLPVVTANREVCGVASEADLIRDLLPRDRRAHEIPPTDTRTPPKAVGDVMSGHPVTVHADTDLVEAIELMTSTTVKSLPVVDRKGRLEGMLSRSDIVRLLARADQDLEREIDELLRSSGLEGWYVQVTDGTAHLVGPEGTRDELVARLLAESVPGVIDVTARTDRAS
jgi:CBS domain-containing protein